MTVYFLVLNKLTVIVGIIHFIIVLLYEGRVLLYVLIHIARQCWVQITFFVCLINIDEYIRVFYGYAFIRSFIAFTGYYIALVSNADNYFNAVVCEDYSC